MELFAKHEERLKKAVAAIKSREFWSVFPESPRSYGSDDLQAGEQVFRDRLGRRFELDHPGTRYVSGDETSPYGVDLGVTYPYADAATLLNAASRAQRIWADTSAEERVGVGMEIVDRLGREIFQMAHSIMYTTGQPFLMAFQLGGAMALDRAVETVAQAHMAMRTIPSGSVQWVKSQGRSDPLEVAKQWRIRPRGIAVAITSATAPTWGGLPGIMASLVTGNAVVVRPHSATILPLAIFVATAREVLAEAGFDPDTVLLSVDEPGETSVPALVTDARVRIVDYDGDSSMGSWLEQHVTGKRLYLQTGSVNSVILDSALELKGVFRNLAASVAMYSGQLRTTPQNIYIPRSGIKVGDELVEADDVAVGLVAAISGLLSDDQRAGDILGAIKDGGVSKRIEEIAGTGEVLLESRPIRPESFPDARMRTPIVIRVDADDRDTFLREEFGPILFVVTTDGTDHSVQLARESASSLGAHTWLAYTTDDEVRNAVVAAAVDAGVPVSLNLTGGLYVNQAAPFSDYSGSGDNPAANVSLVGSAFICDRFGVVGIRSSS